MRLPSAYFGVKPVQQDNDKPKPCPQLLLLDNLDGLLLSYSGAVLFFHLLRKESSQRLSATGKQGD